MSKRHKKPHEEEHENHERWLLTYADMVTLLMVLFIVMFAISQVDQRKFEEFSGGLAKSFGAPVSMFVGGKGILRDTGITPAAVNVAPVASMPRPADSPADMTAITSAGLDQATLKKLKDEGLSAAAIARLAEQARQEAQRLADVQQAIATELAKRGLTDQVRFRIDQRGLVVSIVTDQVLFPPDLAQLSTAGTRVLDAITPALRRIPNMLSVEGHTNQVRVRPKFYPTEWELSSARATSVVRYLIAQGVRAGQLAAVGYADQHPLVSVSDPRSVVLNRRVEIVVESALGGEAAAMVPAAAGRLRVPTDPAGASVAAAPRPG